MPNITLPDGSIRSFDHPVSVLDVAMSISPGLAKAALAARVNGQLCDLSTTMVHDASVVI
jgi:threonyl-tRNA synthetase